MQGLIVILQALSEMLKEPSAIWQVTEILEEHQGLAKRLEVDIARCNAADVVYSPDATACRHDAGGHMTDCPCMSVMHKLSNLQTKEVGLPVLGHRSSK